MNRRALFLSSVMVQGHGVSVVAHEIARRSARYGWDLVIGCLSLDDTFRADNVVEISADSAAILDFCRANGIEAVIAQTTPYFEVLPAVASELPTIVFEHGDPSPGFFEWDAEERQRIRAHKIAHVYPYVHRVVASSSFLRHDIEWPDADVVPLGCDHVADLGIKDLTSTVHRGGERLRVGTLMRLGEGEARYKGVELFAQLVGETDDEFAFSIMGRGNDADRKHWEDLGVDVHLNATDDERAIYLRELDVLVSPSMWEGFNLPLVEAQASGTVGIAFDAGAHPETTPYLADNVADGLTLLRAWAADRNLLARASSRCYHYVRNKFTWDATAALLAGHLDQVAPVPQPAAPPSRLVTTVGRLDGLVRREGIVGSARVVARRGVAKVRRA